MSGGDKADDSGLLARVRAWLGSLFGDGAADEQPETADSIDAVEPSTAPTEPSATHVCTVCGTDVANPAGGCPLCGSSDVRERGAAATEPSGEPAPEPTATTTESTVDGEASRLRELRDGSTDTESASGTEDGASEAE